MEMPSKQRDFVRQAFEIPDAPLDAVDRRIVAELQAAPRLRIAELSRRIGLSGPAVADRLRRLEESAPCPTARKSIRAPSATRSAPSSGSARPAGDCG
jgi:AraC-like DNA-binding protein